MSIGDINSAVAGTAARYNDGKPDMSLVPLWMIVDVASHVSHAPKDAGRASDCAVEVLECLADFQWAKVRQVSRSGPILVLAMAELCRLTTPDRPFLVWEQCAQVFEYGKRKYAAWNWLKGMPYSAVIASATRHTLAILAGEADDKESGLPHAGHLMCNLVMLLEYSQRYPEGDDRPCAPERG